MTLWANDSEHVYTGNGSTKAFDGPRVFDAAHVVIYQTTYDAITGEGTTTQVTSGYSLSRIGTLYTASLVTFDAAPAEGVEISIRRVVPYEQDTSLRNQGVFLPEIHENAFDWFVMMIQQLAAGSIQQSRDPDTGAFVWDAKGLRIVRVGDAVDDTDALNYRSALVLIEQIQDGGGSTGITPKFWSWEGDGVSTDFELVGADVFDPLFYDTAQEATAGASDYLVAKPGDFQILAGVEGSAPAIRFTTAPGEGVRGFTTLRGYARPWIGETPIYTVAPEIVTTGGALTLDATHHNTLILVNASAPVTLTIRANTGASVDWTAGQFFSAMQVGAGQVTVAIEVAAGTLTVPADFVASTRGVGSILSATCTAPDADAWVVAGDLLREQVTPEVQALMLHDRSVLIGANITVGTGKASILMPYGLRLHAISAGGCYASLAVAQSEGNVVTVDVNRNGSSIFSTPLTFDNTEKSTRLATTPAVYASDGDLLYEGDEITLDVDQLGTAAAKGLTVYLVGERVSG